MARYNEQDTLYLSLDSQPRISLNLTSPTGRAIDAAVLWSATDLRNQEHMLEIFPGEYNGEPGYVDVDGFIYTAEPESNPIPSPESSTAPTPFPGSSLPILSPETSYSPIPSPESMSNSSLTDTGMSAAAVGGVAAAGVGLIIMLVVLAVFLWSRIKEKKARQDVEGSTIYSDSRTLIN